MTVAVDIGGVVVPSLIIAACTVVVVVAIVVLRRRADEGPSRLERWQTTHGRTVDAWLDAHEGSLQSLTEGDDPALDRKLTKAMAAAADDSPDPVLRQLLLDMQTTAAATREGVAEGNRLAAESAHVAYSNHRQGAIFRIQQLERASDKPSEEQPQQ
jgi:hypothetical protein